MSSPTIHEVNIPEGMIVTSVMVGSGVGSNCDPIWLLILEARWGDWVCSSILLREKPYDELMEIGRAICEMFGLERVELI